MACLIPPGTKMRDFSGNIVKSDGESTILWSSEKIEGNYIILCFFPMINAVDSTEVNAIKENLDDFSKLNCTVIGVTDEGIPSVKSWINMSPSSGGFGGPVGFDMICDKGMTVAKKFGAKTSSGEPARAIYIMDKKRTIRHSSFYPRYVGRNMDSLLNTVAALKEIDSDNVIIPAGWKPGNKTIKNSPDGIYEYYKISGSSITTGSLVQSKKPPRSVRYSESEVSKLAPEPPSKTYGLSTDSDSSKKSSTQVPSSKKTSKASSVKQTSVDSTPSKLSSKPSSDKTSVSSIQTPTPPSPSSRPSTPSSPKILPSTSTITRPSSPSTKPVSRHSSKPSTVTTTKPGSGGGVYIVKSGPPSSKSSKSGSHSVSKSGNLSGSKSGRTSSSKSPKTSLPVTTKTTSSVIKVGSSATSAPSEETSKSLITSIDGAKMHCECQIKDGSAPNGKKLDCDCSKVGSSQKSNKVNSDQKFSKNKYRVE